MRRRGVPESPEPQPESRSVRLELLPVDLAHAVADVCGFLDVAAPSREERLGAFIFDDPDKFTVFRTQGDAWAAAEVPARVICGYPAAITVRLKAFQHFEAAGENVTLELDENGRFSVIDPPSWCWIDNQVTDWHAQSPPPRAGQHVATLPRNGLEQALARLDYQHANDDALVRLDAFGPPSPGPDGEPQPARIQARVVGAGMFGWTVVPSTNVVAGARLTISLGLLRAILLHVKSEQLTFTRCTDGGRGRLRVDAEGFRLEVPHDDTDIDQKLAAFSQLSAALDDHAVHPPNVLTRVDPAAWVLALHSELRRCFHPEAEHLAQSAQERAWAALLCLTFDISNARIDCLASDDQGPILPHEPVRPLKQSVQHVLAGRLIDAITLCGTAARGSRVELGFWGNVKGTALARVRTGGVVHLFEPIVPPSIGDRCEGRRGPPPREWVEGSQIEEILRSLDQSRELVDEDE